MVSPDSFSLSSVCVCAGVSQLTGGLGGISSQSDSPTQPSRTPSSKYSSSSNSGYVAPLIHLIPLRQKSQYACAQFRLCLGDSVSHVRGCVWAGAWGSYSNNPNNFITHQVRGELCSKLAHDTYSDWLQILVHAPFLSS